MSPFFSLHHPPPDRAPRPNTHQVLGRVAFALGIVYLAFAIALATTAPPVPPSRTKVLVPAVVVPITLWIALLASMDVRLRLHYGSPRRAVWDREGYYQQRRPKGSAGGGKANDAESPEAGDAAAAFDSIRDLPQHTIDPAAVRDGFGDDNDEGSDGPTPKGPRTRDRRMRISGSGIASNSDKFPSPLGGDGGGAAAQQGARSPDGKQGGSTIVTLLGSATLASPTILARVGSAAKRADCAAGDGQGDDGRPSFNAGLRTSRTSSAKVVPLDDARVSPHLNPRIIKDANHLLRPPASAAAAAGAAGLTATVAGAAKERASPNLAPPASRVLGGAPSPVLIPTMEDDVFFEAPTRTSNSTHVKRLVATIPVNSPTRTDPLTLMAQVRERLPPALREHCLVGSRTDDRNLNATPGVWVRRCPPPPSSSCRRSRRRRAAS